MDRHCGRVRELYGPRGKIRVAEGKDLSAVRQLLATGGALTRLPGREDRLRGVLSAMKSDAMAPEAGIPLYFDSAYIMAAAGVLSRLRPGAAAALIMDSFGIRQ